MHNVIALPRIIAMHDVAVDEPSLHSVASMWSRDSRDGDCEPSIDPKASSGGVVMRLAELLAARYPVVRRLAGDESFLRLAHAYFFTGGARCQTLVRYGERFPELLRSLGASGSIEYVADIAALEWARFHAAHAPQSASAPLRPVSWGRGKRLSALRVLLHPSASVVMSRFPIVTIWEANQSRVESRTIAYWRPEAALVARPCLIVECRLLPAGAPAFVGALRSGRTIGGAVAAARLAAPDFNPHLNLELLAQSKVVVDWF